MPAWFKYSKNARNGKQDKAKKYAEPNESTMNRICRAFEDIGNINMNFAGIPPFNWQMLMKEPCLTSRPEIPALFCEMDDRNTAIRIEALNQPYSSERELINGDKMTAEDIERVFVERFGSLEEAYPYVTKYLFAGEGMNRGSHKQMYWRVFGPIALSIIRENLTNYRVCPDCEMKIPSWVETHVCPKNSQGFYQCIECGRISMRTNAKQCRCLDCQKDYKLTQKRIREKKRRKEVKESEEQRIMRLHLFSEET